MFIFSTLLKDLLPVNIATSETSETSIELNTLLAKVS